MADNPFGLNRPGPTDLAGLTAALQSAGYGGPWDQASMVAAFNRAGVPAGGTGGVARRDSWNQQAQALQAQLAQQVAYQKYLQDRMQQLDIPSFQLQQQQQQAANTGYVPIQQMSRDEALDYLYRQNPDVQQLAQTQDWNLSDPIARRNAMAAYLTSVGGYFKANPNQTQNAWEQGITRYGGDPVAIANAMPASPPTPTFARQQWQATDDMARQQQRLQLAQVLGYMPGTAGFTAPQAGGLANEPGRVRTAVMPEGYTEPLPGSVFNAGGEDNAGFPGTPTLAARQWQAANQLGVRAQTLAERQVADEQAARIAGLTGQYNGQNTQAAQQQAFQQGIERERLGLQSREQTLAELAQAAQSGIAVRAQSLAEQRAADEQAARLFGQGIQGRGQSLAELTAEREYGLGGRAQSLAELAQATQSGIAERGQTLAESEAARRAAMERAGASGYMEGPSFDVSRIRAALSNNFTQPISQVSPEQFVARFQSATGVGGDEARRAYEAIANATFRVGRPEVGAEELGQILTGAGIGRQQTLAGQQQQFQQGMAEREYGLSSRAQTLSEQRAADEQAARLFGQGIAGRGQSLAELTAEREYGLGGRAQTLAEQRAEREYGLGTRAQALAETQAERGYGLQGRAQTLAEVAQAAQSGIAVRAQSLAEQEAARRGGLESQQFAESQRQFGATLAQQRELANEENTLRRMGLTQEADKVAIQRQQVEGQLGLGARAQTLAETEAARRAALESASLTGLLSGQQTLGARAQTLAESEATRRGGLEAAALMGLYNGQQTVAGRSLDEQIAARRAQEALQAAALTGQYGNQATLAARQQALEEAERRRQFGLQQGALTGTYGGAPTLQALQFAAALRGPENAFQQQAYLHGLNNQGVSRAVGAISGQGSVPAFQAPQAAVRPASMGALGQPANVDATLGALPAPNKIVGRTFIRLPGDTQKFLMSGYEQQGYSPDDVRTAVLQGLPQFRAPKMGRIAA